MDKGFPTPLNYLIDQQVTIAKKQETNKNTQHTPHWGKDNGQKKCAHYKKKIIIKAQQEQ